MKFRHKYSWLQPRTKLVETHCYQIGSVSSKPFLLVLRCSSLREYRVQDRPLNGSFILSLTCRSIPHRRAHKKGRKQKYLVCFPVTLTNIQTVVETMTVFLPRSILHSWLSDETTSNRGKGGSDFVLFRIF